MAIEQARLLERIRQNSMLFLDLASAINSSLDIKEIMHNMTADITKALGMKGVSILLLNEDTDALDLVASYGLSEAFINKGPLSTEKSVIQTLKGETVVIMNVTTDKRIQYQKEMKKEKIVSMLSAPIKAREKVIGVMRLFFGVAREFPEDMIIMVNALAHMGGLAIENASCYLTLQEDMKDLKKDLWTHRSWF